ncbi:HU family DNA-binding protein [Paracoccaceae bacterium Fryx2]|nr:HU family DNA-binding protein [Paracoccaceae bacterium Fryx2]
MAAPDLSTLSIAELRVLAGELARAIAAKRGPNAGENHPMTRLNKTDIVSSLSVDLNIPQRDIHAVVDTLPAAISDAAANGDAVQLRGFGTFAPRTRKARLARNPAMGAEVTVAEKTVLTFKAAPAKAGV